MYWEKVFALHSGSVFPPSRSGREVREMQEIIFGSRMAGSEESVFQVQIQEMMSLPSCLLSLSADSSTNTHPFSPTGCFETLARRLQSCVIQCKTARELENQCIPRMCNTRMKQCKPQAVEQIPKTLSDHRPEPSRASNEGRPGGIPVGGAVGPLPKNIPMVRTSHHHHAVGDGVAALFLQRSHVKLCGGSCTMARQDMEAMPCVRDSCSDSMSQIAAKTNGGRFSNGSGLKCQQKAEDSGTASRP